MKYSAPEKSPSLTPPMVVPDLRDNYARVNEAVEGIRNAQVGGS